MREQTNGRLQIKDLYKANTLKSGTSKYRNEKIELDGMVFDSKHEAHRWCELKYMERVGLIKDLKRQVRFEVIPAQYDERDRIIERPTTYIADFVYTENGKKVVEDAKSPATKTDVYKIKKKLMLQKYGIRIREV